LNSRLGLIDLIFLTACTFAQAQPDLSIIQSSGLKVAVINKDFPLLKLLLPGQPTTDRGIEIEFPEHVTGVNEKTDEVKQFYFVARGNSNKRTLPKWRIEGQTLVYQTDLDGGIAMIATARLEPDGLRYTYEFTNHSNSSYKNLQAVTCVKLYSLFSDTLLERTYVHHATGFELLASETPERLTMKNWLPCRYLVSYTWPVNSKRVEKDEDNITRYHKSKKVDRPFIATYSHDKKWIAATYTKETGNLWTNPERSCQHADPATVLKAGQTAKLELKTFVIKGDLQQMLRIVDKEQGH
jgi:hypothetical protein